MLSPWAVAFVVAALFPYISPISIGSDTQPWALLLSLPLFVMASPRLGLMHFALGLMAAAAILMFLIEGGGTGAARNMAGYVSMFTIAVAASGVMERQKQIGRLIDWAIIIWVAVGLFQRTVSKGAFTFLVASVRTDPGRGVTSLAPEPTYFASIILLLVLWRALIGVTWWHIAALSVAVVVLATSSQILLILLAASIVAGFAYWRKYPWLPVIMTVAAASLVVVIAQLAKDSRIGQLVTLALENPGLILSRDESANERFVHIFAGLYSVVDHWFLPSGILSAQWTLYLNRIIQQFPSLFWVPQNSDRIMSAMGALFYQMGFLCLPLIGAVFAALWRWDEEGRLKTVWAVAFALLMLTALPLGHPLIGVILGSLASISDSGRHAKRIRTRRLARSHILPERPG